jgi:hypothetical protein
MWKLFIGVLLLLGVQSARADDVVFPRHDVEADCRAMIDSSKPSSEVATAVFNACVAREQLSYDFLKSTWSKIPDEIRSLCIENKRLAARASEKWLLYYGLFECAAARFDVYLATHHHDAFGPYIGVTQSTITSRF